MSKLFTFSFTLKLPVYTVSVTGGTAWYGFGRDRAVSTLHWHDFLCGPCYISIVHRQKYEESLDAELHRIFTPTSDNRYIIRLDEQDVAEGQHNAPIDRDLLN